MKAKQIAISVIAAVVSFLNSAQADNAPGSSVVIEPPSSEFKQENEISKKPTPKKKSVKKKKATDTKKSSAKPATEETAELVRKWDPNEDSASSTTQEAAGGKKETIYIQQEQTLSEIHRESLLKRRAASERRESKRVHLFRKNDGALTLTNKPAEFRGREGVEEVNEGIPKEYQGKADYQSVSVDYDANTPSGTYYLVRFASGLTQKADSLIRNDPYYDIVVSGSTYSIRKALIKSVEEYKIK